MTNELAPNFFIIGAAKAATTSLSSLLNLHPDAAIVRGKESHYFSDDQLYIQGWEFYLSLFNHCWKKTARGDASTSYSRIRYYPKVVDRIYERAPEAKIIYMVRHPLERMESAYLEHLCTPGGPVFSSINDAVKRQPMIVDSSRYGEVFDAYRERFGESQVKIVWFEEYTIQTQAVFQDVCRFLGISEQRLPDFRLQYINGRAAIRERLTRVGRSHIQWDTEWDSETRQWVLDQIRDDNCRFLAKAGRRKDYWGDLF